MYVEESKSMILFLAITCAVVINVTTSCRCPGKIHIQTSICSAEFAIKAKIISKEKLLQQSDKDSSNSEINSDDPFAFLTRKPPSTVSTIWKYRIKILSNLKSNGDFNAADLSHIYFEEISEACSVILDTSKTYLLTGSVEDAKLQLSFCDLRQLWSSVSNKQKKYLKKGRYVDNCECPINNCIAPNVCPITSDAATPQKECIYDGKGLQCYNEHNFCKKDGDSCIWLEGKLFKSCLEELDKSDE